MVPYDQLSSEQGEMDVFCACLLSAGFLRSYSGPGIENDASHSGLGQLAPRHSLTDMSACSLIQLRLSFQTILGCGRLTFKIHDFRTQGLCSLTGERGEVRGSDPDCHHSETEELGFSHPHLGDLCKLLCLSALERSWVMERAEWECGPLVF